jgi:hypothetical protein
MFKMGSHRPFGHLKQKLWPKERSKVKLAIWLPTTKTRKSTRFPFLAYRERVTYRWKALDDDYNFPSNLIASGGLHAKLCTSKVARVLVVGISGFPFGSPREKVIWMWPPWKVAEYIIREKVVASPKSRPWWVLYVRVARGSS